jgi:beta-lactamase class A
VTPAGAQDSAQPAEVRYLTEMFSDAPLSEDRFSAEVLAQVPFTQLKAIIDELKATVGHAVRIDSKGGYNHLIVTATHVLPVQIVVDASGKISGILFQPPLRSDLTTADALMELGPDVAYLVTRNGEVLNDRRAGEPLAVGSAFKLGVLAALKDEIEAGKRAWDDVVALEDEHKSLPTGMLQDWPEGAPVTLHTLSSLMISISDNTATDALLDLVGREAAAKKLGIDHVLSTREFFVLKANDALRERFIGGDVDGAVAEIAKTDLKAITGIHPLHQKGVEWYVPLTTLCGLIAEVGELDVTQINTGVTNPEDWASVAFKGGSESGVLNLTTQVTAKNGDVYCVAATWNMEAPVDEPKMMGAYAGVISSLAQNP